MLPDPDLSWASELIDGGRLGTAVAARAWSDHIRVERMDAQTALEVRQNWAPGDPDREAPDARTDEALVGLTFSDQQELILGRQHGQLRRSGLADGPWIRRLSEALMSLELRSAPILGEPWSREVACDLRVIASGRALDGVESTEKFVAHAGRLLEAYQHGTLPFGWVGESVLSGVLRTCARPDPGWRSTRCRPAHSNGPGLRETIMNEQELRRYEHMWTVDLARYALLEMHSPPASLILDLEGGLVIMDDHDEVVAAVMTRLRDAGARILTLEEWRASRGDR